MMNDIYLKIEVYFQSKEKAEQAIDYMRNIIKESNKQFVSVYDLIKHCGYLSVSWRFAQIDDKELKNWGWTNIDGYSLDSDVMNMTIILAMPPAERMYYPLTSPPQPYIPRKDGKSTMAFAVWREELKNYVKPKLIYIPTKEEIAASIEVFLDYDINDCTYKFCYVYKDRATNQTYKQMHILTEMEYRGNDFRSSWDSVWREELINYVRKMYDEKKKELEKEKLKMYVKNVNAIDERIRRSSSDFAIEGSIGDYPAATIKCPLYSLDELFGFEDNSPKKSKPVNSVKITNIEMYNNRVVKVTFDDGSFTKSVCQENDIFDLDVGITICLIKKMLDTGKGDGTKIYNDIIRDAHKLINDKENEKIEKQMKKEKEKKKARKAQMNKQAKKMKAKEEAIDIQKQAIIRAYQEMELMKDGE